MNYPKQIIKKQDLFSLEELQKLDYLAVEQYLLSTELLMENAGGKLSEFVVNQIDINSKILIGIGFGNNGGDGLVAARRLKGWGYDVCLDIPDKNFKGDMPKLQYDRAMLAGCKERNREDPDIFVDCYFGFSQRLPLPEVFVDAISRVNKMNCKKVSLDIPAGISDKYEFFQSDYILTLAAAKEILYEQDLGARIFVADIGMPEEIYEKIGRQFRIAFQAGAIVEIDYDSEIF